MTIGTVPTQMVSQAYIDPLQIPVKNADPKYRVGFNDHGGWTQAKGTENFNGSNFVAADPGLASAFSAYGRKYIDVPLTPAQKVLVADGSYQLQVTVESSTFASQNDTGGFFITAMGDGGAEDWQGGYSFGPAKYDAATPVFPLIWLPPDTTKIRFEMNGYIGTGPEVSHYLGFVKMALVQHPTDTCVKIFANQNSQAIIDSFTITVGVDRWRNITTWGHMHYPGTGGWTEALTQMILDVPISGLPAKAQTEIGLGNAQLTVTFYEYADDFPDEIRTRVDCLDSSNVNQQTVGRTAWFAAGRGGASSSYTESVPAVTDKFRVYYDGQRVEGTYCDCVASNYYATLQYPKA